MIQNFQCFNYLIKEIIKQILIIFGNFPKKYSKVFSQ